VAQTRLLLLASALVHDCFSSYVINFGHRRNYLGFFVDKLLTVDIRLVPSGLLKPFLIVKLTVSEH